MTRDHAALQLLAHGCLSRSEFREITGWKLKACDQVIYRLRNAGLVRISRSGMDSVYVLASGGGEE